HRARRARERRQARPSHRGRNYSVQVGRRRGAGPRCRGARSCRSAGAWRRSRDRVGGIDRMNEFSPGLAGVVAFETEIAEPDREGGSLRYRGVDIEELVGKVPFEKVWGLLVDESLEPGLPASYCELPIRTGGYMSDLQAGLAVLGGRWGFKQLIDIDVEQAKEDLRRLSAAALSLVAQSARGDEP